MTRRLAANGIKKSYKGKPVVQGISIDVSAGDVVGLLGPNGAGKTTTFYMMVGLVKPDEGTITLDGAGIGDMPMYRRARMGIGYLPQESSIFKHITVLENLMVVMEIMGMEADEGRVRAMEILAEFHLSHLADNSGFHLSGGERRRVEIARAIAMNPAFLLLDEPFAGVDPITIGDLQKTITYLKHKGIGVIITDHNVRDTLSITDRAYIVSGGRILESGTPGELVESPVVRKAYLGDDFSI